VDSYQDVLVLERPEVPQTADIDLSFRIPRSSPNVEDFVPVPNSTGSNQSQHKKPFKRKAPSTAIPSNRLKSPLELQPREFDIMTTEQRHGFQRGFFSTISKFSSWLHTEAELDGNYPDEWIYRIGAMELADLALNVCDLAPNERILDIGCGTG